MRASKVKLIVVDGVFSMEGDWLTAGDRAVGPYKANIMVDEAHSLGVMGRRYNGKGVCDHFGLLDEWTW